MRVKMGDHSFVLLLTPSLSFAEKHLLVSFASWFQRESIYFRCFLFLFFLPRKQLEEGVTVQKRHAPENPPWASPSEVVPPIRWKRWFFTCETWQTYESSRLRIVVSPAVWKGQT